MKLKILSLKQALDYVPKDKTGIIRISDGFDWYNPPLKPSSKWIDVQEGIGIYSFDDQWPENWKEYEGVSMDELYSRGIIKKTWSEMKKEFPRMTEKSLLSFLETRGQVEDRPTLFTPTHAQRIFAEYHKYWKDADTLIIHCNRGENRSAAIGKAMNEIYGWGIKGLEKEKPNYRRFIYNLMINEAKRFRLI